MLLGLLTLLACAPGLADDTSTHSGLFFTIQNNCSSAVVGFAVGDKICLLQIESATFTRGIFQGTMLAGEEKTGMACTGTDGNASVLFVPPPSSGAQAVLVTVTPNETVSIPSTFCSTSSADPKEQLRHEGEGGD
jgi:hypothetical protein